MKAATLLLFGVLVGFLCTSRRKPVPFEMAIDTEEMATPSIFRRTVRLRYRAADPVSKGVAPTPV